MLLLLSWNWDPHAYCRLAYCSVHIWNYTRVPACSGMIARTWRYMAQYTWLRIVGAWIRACVYLYLCVCACVCKGPPMSSPFPCLLKPACAFSMPPTANLTAQANLFLMTTSHTPTCPHSQTHTRVAGTSWISVSHQNVRVCIFSQTWLNQLRWINIWCKSCLHKWSVRHVWTSHTLHADRHTHTNPSNVAHR